MIKFFHAKFKFLYITCTFLATLTGCLDVGDVRAQRDEVVGQAKSESLSVNVKDGHASVRSFSAGELTLWGQAPTLQWTLKTGTEAQMWSIRVRNSMNAAKLTLTKDGASPQSLIRQPSTLPTVGQWTTMLDANSTYTMTLKTDDADLEGSFRFVVYADVQDKIGQVQDIYQTMSLDDTIQFGLISGDLTEQGAVAELERFQKEMETLPFPCFATLGNHELGNGETLFHDYFGRGNYSFVYRGVRFTMLDSASATISPMVYPWLDQWLSEGRDQLHMVIMHIPPLDADGFRHGAFASRGEAMQLLKRLADGNVDMTIYGHVHTYTAFSNAGIPAFISGGGGAIPMRLDGIGRHYMQIDAQAGFRFVPGVVRVYPE